MLAALVALSAASAFGQQSEEAMRKKLLEVAFKYRGVPYVYGAESATAFDCSGFVRWVYREAYGIELPRSARQFYSAGSPVDSKVALAGDVFVYDTVGGAPSHVAIYVGDNTVIHAVSEGQKTGVIVSPTNDRYWAPRLIAARRFIGFAVGSAVDGAVAVPVPGKPAATPLGKPEAKPSAAELKAEQAVADIGIVIPAARASFFDRIPAAAGTSIAFTLTNGSGKGGSFIVLFFRIDPTSYKLVQIHDEKVKLAGKAVFSLPPYRFDDPGKYKLVVKDSWGNPLVEREFMVNDAGR